MSIRGFGRTLLVGLLLACSRAEASSILFPGPEGQVWQVQADRTVAAVPFQFHSGKCSGATGFGTSCPVPSPDQRLVAFTKDNDLWVYELETKQAHRITRVGQPSTERYARVFVYITGWSRDGGRVLYHVDHGLNYAIEGHGALPEARTADYGHFIYDRRAGTSDRVSFPGTYQAWLPDGRFLLVSRESPWLDSS